MTVEQQVALEAARKQILEMKREAVSTPEQIVEKYFSEPLAFVRWTFPWRQPGILERFDGPDVWQAEFLNDLGRLVKERAFDGRNAVTPIRMAVSAGQGPGKGALAAWITTWIMSTRPFSQGTVTANTFTQLETKTWSAVEQWFRLSKTAKYFVIGPSGVRHIQHGRSWKVTPQTSREENSESFAGQHAATSTSFYVLDESSSIPEKIWEVAEGGLTDGHPMIFAFGNPTRSSGKFFRINFGSERNRWNSRVIDSRNCMMPNKAQIAEWIADYGEDSDFVRVRVKGLPPQSSDLQYIDAARVYEAQRRKPVVLANEPLVAGVDLARGGSAKAVIRFRCGDDALSRPPIKIPGEQVKDSMLLVAKLADLSTTTFGGKRVAMWFVDSGAMGGPIIDRLQQLGHKQFTEIQFGGQCPDPKHYANMRSFMWAKMRDAINDRLAIDSDKELESDLTGPGIHHDKQDRIVLESKENMQKRGLASPDDGDALALTYARPVAPTAPGASIGPIAQRYSGSMAGFR